MTDNAWGQVDGGARKLIPVLTALVLILLAHTPVHLPGFSTITPLLGLMAIYHWTLHRPDLVPSIAIFALGLVTDALSGAPFGTNALVFLGVYGVVLAQRRFFHKKSFAVLWAAFLPITAAAAFLYWLLFMAMTRTLIDPAPLVFQVGITGALYPLVYYALAVAQRSLIERS
jgi:rod shape-determining protein MreD